MSWHGQRGRFDKFVVDLFNANHNTLKTRFEADNEPTPERLDAATAAREKEATICRQFRDWCTQMRDSIPRELDDTTKEFSETERAEGQRLHDDIVKRLPALADCPTGEASPPLTSGRPARRSWP